MLTRAGTSIQRRILVDLRAGEASVRNHGGERGDEARKKKRAKHAPSEGPSLSSLLSNFSKICKKALVLFEI